MKSETAASGVIVPYWNAILSEMTRSLNTVATSPPSAPVTSHGVAKLLAISTSIILPLTSVDFMRISSSVTIHWIPTSDTGSTIAGDTASSLGHIPVGRKPSFSSKRSIPVIRWFCTSSGHDSLLTRIPSSMVQPSIISNGMIGW